MLKNKKILLCVSASISFYKAFEILSLLKKAGADVYVAMSEATLRFCSPLAFEALSAHKVLCAANEDWTGGATHIGYAKVDLAIVAPASANTISKIACGIADNPMLAAILACPAPKVVAPAANTNMIENPAIISNLNILRERGFSVVEPESKTLACGDVGKGALANPEKIVAEAIRAISRDPFWEGKKVIVTGGATSEKIDPVRAITNFSSGKMARALADAFYYAGAEVTLIASFGAPNAPYSVFKFESSRELLAALNAQSARENDILVMCAAVSDYIPICAASEKIKKSGSNLKLEFAENLDVLGSSNLKCKKIGFKAETDAASAINAARNMLGRKNLDAVCLNVLGGEVTFGGENTQITFVSKAGEKTLPLAPKAKIAAQIAELAKSL